VAVQQEARKLSHFALKIFRIFIQNSSNAGSMHSNDVSPELYSETAIIKKTSTFSTFKNVSYKQVSAK
jgi:hypothetical protein